MTFMEHDRTHDWPVAHAITQLRAHHAALEARYHIAELGVFGSYVRNEQQPESDLDVLVSFIPTPIDILATSCYPERG